MTERERARAFYKIIKDGELGDNEEGTYRKCLAIGALETITNKQFNNTADFHREVSAFIENEIPSQSDLLKLRKSMNLSQRIFAIRMGVTQAEIVNMENGRKPLNKKALAFMRKNPHQSYAPPENVYQNLVDYKQDAGGKIAGQ